MYQPKFGFILIKLDLKSMNIDPENASFIDLDISKTLNLEIKFNIQRVMNFSGPLDQMTHKQLHRHDGYSKIEWF